MKFCPRDGGWLTEITEVPRSIRAGRRVSPEPIVVGYRCENGHTLNLGEEPIEAGEE